MEYSDEIKNQFMEFIVYKMMNLINLVSNFQQRKNFKENKNKSGIYYVNKSGLGIERFINLDSIVNIIKKESPQYNKPDYL